MRNAGGAPWRDLEIVGVVSSVKHFSLDEEPTGTAYAPITQVAPGAVSFVANNFNLVARTATDSETLTPALRGLIARSDPEVATSATRTMEQVLAASLAARRFNMTLLAIFAIMALVLAACGLHALVSYTVVLRAREVAIRMALGARPGGVLRSFVGQGLRLALAGAAIGLLGAVLLTRTIAGLLYGVAPIDAVTFVLAPLVLAAIAALASFVPACRVLRVEPMTVLRSE